ncbi:MAG: hypothetical protein J6U58_02935 [Bacteroidaceae bacterium]|nr:hypothetical protein [Bacteroidaceae bacterium]
MKKIQFIPLFLFLAFILSSCEKSVEEPARILLDKAQTLYEAGNYNSAKQTIDSMGISFPKAYKTRREGEILRRRIMLDEKQRDVEYFTALYDSLAVQRDEMVKSFTLNKNSKYQDEGFYFVPSQSLGANPFNNFLRAIVKESGDAYIMSYYRGNKIGYNTVKVSSGDSFVICDAPFLSRSYKEYGVYNERRDYKYGNDGGIMDFIAVADGPLRVELLGGTEKCRYTLRNEDAIAVRRILELSKLLKAVNEAAAMRDEAQRALDFLLKSQERSKQLEEKEIQNKIKP